MAAVCSAPAADLVESRIKLEIALILAELLRDEGFQVMMTRDSDGPVSPNYTRSGVRSEVVQDLQARVDIANARIGFASGVVANITSSRVSRERMRKIRIFQKSGYISLDLAAGNGEFYRLRGDVDLAALAKAPLALEAFVERVPLEAPEGEPLRLEFESFVGAVLGESPIAVSGAAGREALAVALRILHEIERTAATMAGTPRA